MKFPYSMLLDYVSTSLNAEEAGDLLTMAGFELEDIEEVDGEPVLDVKVMSNRGDGLSMLGLAREILAKDEAAIPTALYEKAAGRFAQAVPGSFHNPVSVEIKTDDCRRFACRLFRNVTNGASPAWVQDRLKKAGQRPISLFVDLTNYVMLELGQPLHAFDFDRIGVDKIVVRQAAPGENLKTLDGQEHELLPNQMMICDDRLPISVAGVMGGEATEVHQGTTTVLLESANFLNTSIRKTRKQMGFNTDASYRFERSVDPDGVVAAIERFTELLGEPGSAIVDSYPGRRERQPLTLRVDRANRMLGFKVPSHQAQQYLERLGMEVAGHGDPFFVIPPSWRPDLAREIDLIEEVGRVHGYERIPEEMPVGLSTQGGTRGALHNLDRLTESAIRAGFIQLVSHSLRDLHPLDAATPRVEPRSPASPDMAYLRNSLWPSLSDAVNRNGGRDLHLFEVGKVFSKAGDCYVEEREMSFVSIGALLPTEKQGETVPQAEFFSLKGELLGILAQAGWTAEAVLPKATDARLHPTRQASLKLSNGSEIGKVGQIHPDIAEAGRLPLGTILAELDLDVLLCQPQEGISLKPVSRNPAVRRDIALLIEKSIPFSRIRETVEQAGGDVLERQWLFDQFEGQGIPEGKHSLGIALQLRKLGSNLTDEEANQVRETVVAALATLGGTTR